MYCRKGYEVCPQRSAAGYYMGTCTEDGEPNCRVSSKYAPTAEAAKALPLDRDYAIEIQMCNGYAIDGCRFTERKPLRIKK